MFALGRADLNVSDLRRGNCDVAAPLIGDPQHVGGTAQRGFAARFHIVAGGVIDVERDLARGLRYTDSDFHGSNRTAFEPQYPSDRTWFADTPYDRRSTSSPIAHIWVIGCGSAYAFTR